MQPLERCEQVIGVGHIEPGAVITDVEKTLVFFAFLPEYNLGLRLFCRIFPRIAKKVYQDNLH